MIDPIETMHAHVHTPIRILSIATLATLGLFGCPLDGKQIGDPPDTSETSSGPGDGDGDSGDGDGDGPFDNCEGPFSSPWIDPECDSVGFLCDNAREHHNPGQEDQDFDGYGDVADLCQLTFGDTNTGDTDKDGIGNACDTCRKLPDDYNIAGVIADPRMWVRNVPAQSDFDHDGIGDVCDNCITVANCGDFSGAKPHGVGMPVPDDDASVCQTDDDRNMIGDACTASTDLDNAAGPVGYLATDDFDQDGIVNAEDYCPRQPLAADYAERIACTDDADCPSVSCAPTAALNGVRYCNHADTDNDTVGDACDTCPYSPNGLQVTDAGMQIDDEDFDFVGAECETHVDCSVRRDPRPYAFMSVAVEGMCCTTTYPGDGQYVMTEGGEWACTDLCDPGGFPIRRDCAEADEAQPGDVPDGVKCRRLPASVLAQPGVVELPPGCEAALDAAGLCSPSPANDFSCADVGPEEVNRRLTLADIPDENQLWSTLCFLPQTDGDFDGLGSSCDTCQHHFDPSKAPYIDENDMVWDNVGQVCSGDPVELPGALCGTE